METRRKIVILITIGLLVASGAMLYRGVPYLGAATLAYVASAVFWIVASFRAEFPPTQRNGSSNLLNAVAAALAALGTTAGIDNGVCKMAHPMTPAPKCQSYATAKG